MQRAAAELTDEIATLMRSEFKADGDTLSETVTACRRRLPRRLRRDADFLAQIEPLAAHPKLSHQLDHARVTRAHRDLKAHLIRIGAHRRRGEIALAILGSVAFSLLGVVVLVIVVLRWRGFL